jgi:hypothetical protein
LPTLGILPAAGLTLLLGVERFMSEIRAVTNLFSNISRPSSYRDGWGSLMRGVWSAPSTAVSNERTAALLPPPYSRNENL